MSNYIPWCLHGDGVPNTRRDEDNMVPWSTMLLTAEALEFHNNTMLLTAEALENKAAWAKIEKRLAENKSANDGCKAAWAKEAMAKAAWAEAHGMEAKLANGYLSIAELACDEKKKQKNDKGSKVDFANRSIPITEKVLRCNPPWDYCTRQPSTGLDN